MILLDRPVVVEKSRFRAGHDVEIIGRASVLEIVDDGGKDSGKNFQIRQPVLRRERMKENTLLYFRLLSFTFYRLRVTPIQREASAAVASIYKSLTTVSLYINNNF
jgi:hypothetical protein